MRPTAICLWNRDEIKTKFDLINDLKPTVISDATFCFGISFTLLYSTVPYYALFYSTVLYRAYSTVFYSALLYSTLLYSALFYCTLPCFTLLYSILPYSTMLSFSFWEWVLFMGNVSTAKTAPSGGHGIIFSVMKPNQEPSVHSWTSTGWCLWVFFSSFQKSVEAVRRKW